MPKRLTTCSRRAGTQKHSPLIPRIAFILGTRPEAIKLAPVILEMRRRRSRLQPVVISTGQQADLVGPALETFGLRPDVDLHVMRPRQSLARLTSRCLTRISDALQTERPEIVVVQGDTTSALAGAQAAFLERIPVAHVEAGLRTGNLAAPFPEEANRQMISRLAELHFAPTVDAKANLLAEGIDAGKIEVTGNTVVDAIEWLHPQIAETPLRLAVPHSQKLVLVTAHRRENLGQPLRAICDAVVRLARQRRELHFAFVTHPNPAAAETVRRRLADRNRITLLPPLPYLETLRLVAASWLILTDSGGLQEEAPSFSRPVLVLRDHTERTEGLAAGVARLVGTKTDAIMHEVITLLDSPTAPAQSLTGTNPYGDGHAAERIIAAFRGLIGSSLRVSRNSRVA